MAIKTTYICDSCGCEIQEQEIFYPYGDGAGKIGKYVVRSGDSTIQTKEIEEILFCPKCNQFFLSMIKIGKTGIVCGPIIIQNPEFEPIAKEVANALEKSKELGVEVISSAIQYLIHNNEKDVAKALEIGMREWDV